jgi:hypothetical protein
MQTRANVFESRCILRIERNLANGNQITMDQATALMMTKVRLSIFIVLNPCGPLSQRIFEVTNATTQ